MSNTINPTGPQKIATTGPQTMGVAPLATGPTSLQVGITRTLAGEAVATLKDATAVLDAGKGAATSQGIVQGGVSGIEERAATALGSLTSFLEAKPQAKASASFDHPTLVQQTLTPNALTSTLAKELGSFAPALTTQTSAPTAQQQKSAGLRMAIKDAIALDQTRSVTTPPSLVATTVAQNAEKAGLKQAVERAAGSKGNSTRMTNDPYAAVSDPGVQSKLEGVFSKMGDITSMGDIDACVNLLMMMIAKDAEQDLRAIADEMKKNLDMKKKLRDLKATQKEDIIGLKNEAQRQYSELPESVKDKLSFDDFWKSREVTVFEPVINQDTGEILYQKPELGALDASELEALVDSEAPPVVEEAPPQPSPNKILQAAQTSIAEQDKKMKEKLANEVPDWDKVTQDVQNLLAQGLPPGALDPKPKKDKTKKEEKVEQKKGKSPDPSKTYSAGKPADLLNGKSIQMRMVAGEEKVGPGGMRVTRMLASDLDSVVEKTDDTMETMKELGEEQQMRLQAAMDRRSQAQTTMSNLMKKISETASNLIGNLK